MVDNKCEVVTDGTLCKFGLHCSVEIKTLAIRCLLISFPFVTVLVYQCKVYQMNQPRGNMGLLKGVDAMGEAAEAACEVFKG